MRRLLDLLSFGTLAVLLLITGFALVGPGRLPEKVAAHLDSLGQPDAWASRASFEIFPVIAVVVFLVLTVVAAYSSLAKYADHADTGSAPPLEAIILRLIVSIKFELMAIFTCMQFSSLHGARHPDQPSSLWSIGTWVMLAVILVTIGRYVIAMVRLGHAETQRRTSY